MDGKGGGLAESFAGMLGFGADTGTGFGIGASATGVGVGAGAAGIGTGAVEGAIGGGVVAIQDPGMVLQPLLGEPRRKGFQRCRPNR